jgi:hypothetical protein
VCVTKYVLHTSYFPFTSQALETLSKGEWRPVRCPNINAGQDDVGRKTKGANRVRTRPPPHSPTRHPQAVVVVVVVVVVVQRSKGTRYYRRYVAAGGRFTATFAGGRSKQGRCTTAAGRATTTCVKCVARGGSRKYRGRWGLGLGRGRRRGRGRTTTAMATVTGGLLARASRDPSGWNVCIKRCVCKGGSDC